MLPSTPGGDDPEQGQVAVGDVEAGEQHDRLARDRDAGALERHQQEDAGEPGGVDEVGRDVDDRVDDRGRSWLASREGVQARMREIAGAASRTSL